MKVDNERAQINKQINVNAGGDVMINNNQSESTIEQLLTQSPFSPDVFWGRDDEMKEIYDLLWGGKKMLLLVNGEGGIGKTTIASSFFHQYKKEYKHLAWVLAGENLTDSLLGLADALNISFPDHLRRLERIQLLVKKLANLPEPCLLVIDNANTLSDLEETYLVLRSCPNFHILLTTRISQFEEAEVLSIGPLKISDAVKLFRHHYKKHNSDEDELLLAILEAVGRNTLVIELLAKNLTVNNLYQESYSLKDLLDDLQSQNLLALSKSKEVQVRYQIDGFTLRKEKAEDIISAMYDLGKLSEAEQNLLAVFSVLPPKMIKYQDLKLFVLKDIDPFLQSLSQKGWIEHNPDNHTFKISPVIQEVCKAKISLLYDACSSMINMLNGLLQSETGTGHLKIISYEQGIHLIEYAESILASISDVKDGLARLTERVGRFHEATGNLDRAKIYFEMDVKISEALVQTNKHIGHQQGLAVAYQHLGNTYQSMGQLSEALTYFQKSNEIFLKIYKPHFPIELSGNDLAISFAKLGSTHRFLGNEEESISLFMEGHRIYQELFQKDPDSPKIQNGLAHSYTWLGDYECSIGNLEKALIFYEKDFGLNQALHRKNPKNMEYKGDLAQSYGNRAEVQVRLGNMDVAVHLFELHHKLCREIAEDHPPNTKFKSDLARSCSNLGRNYYERGKIDKALELLEENLTLTQELHESDSINEQRKRQLAIANKYLGDIYQTKNELRKAFPFIREFYAISLELHQNYPDNVPYKQDLAIASNSMAKLLFNFGEKKQAEALFIQGYNIQRQLLVNSPQNIDFQGNYGVSCQELGQCYTLIGNYEKSASYYQEYLQISQTLLKDNPANFRYSEGLILANQKCGELSKKMGKVEDAQKYFLQAKVLLEKLIESLPQKSQYQEWLKEIQIELGE